MAIAFDASSQSGGGSLDSSGTTLTWSHTCTGSNRVLWAAFTYRSAGSAIQVSSATYNGVALTFISRRLVGTAGAGQTCVEQWYLTAPATGANNIVLTLSANINSEASGLGGGYAVSLTGVDQTTAFDSESTATGSGTAETITITTVATNTALCSAVWSNNGSEYPASTHTRFATFFGNGTHSAGYRTGVAASGTNTFNWTTSGSYQYGTIVAAFKEDGGSIVPLTATLSDTETYSDAQGLLLAGLLGFNDTISFGDTLGSDLGFPFVTGEFNDTVAFTDSLSVYLGIPALTNAFSDTVSFTDFLSISLRNVGACSFDRLSVKTKVAAFFNNPTYYTAIDLNDSIQDGSDEIIAFTGCNYGTAVIPFVKDLSYYDFMALIPDFIGVVAIFNSVTKRWMIPESVRKLDNIREDWECSIGTPEYFSLINHRYVVIYRKPGIVSYGNMYVLYKASCPTLADSTTIPIPLEYSALIEEYVQTDLWEQQQEFTKASKCFKDYISDLAKLHNLVHNKIQMDRTPGL